MGSNCVTLVDDQGLVIYANAAMLEMLRVAEVDLRAVVPEFQANLLDAGNFAVARLHQELGVERLRQLEHPWRTEVEIGRRVFALVITPVIDASRQRLSTVIEWLDRTGEIAIEREVAAIVEAAANGNFPCAWPWRTSVASSCSCPPPSTICWKPTVRRCRRSARCWRVWQKAI